MACESCSKFQKDKMLSIFPALVFGRRNANWKKDKMLSIFPFRFSMGKCVGLGIEVVPERQPGMAPLLQSLKLYFPHLPWWLKN